MASNPHIDCSDDIRAFRRVQSMALSERLPKLEYEINRIKPLLDSEVLKTDPVREKELAIFINCADLDLQAVKEFYLFHTSFQYALLKKEISTPVFNQFYDVVKAYDGNVLTSNEAASFLAGSHLEIRSVLTALSHILNDITVLDEGLSCIKESNDFFSRKQSLLDFINGYRDPMALCKEISAFDGSYGHLEAYVLGDLDSYIRDAERITEESYIIKQTVSSSIDILFFSHLVYYVHPEGLKIDDYVNNPDEFIQITRQAYKEALNGAFAFAAESGMINKAECDAITGASDGLPEIQSEQNTTKANRQKNRTEEANEKRLLSVSTSDSQDEVTVARQEIQRVEFFPFIEDAIKDEDVIDIIVDTIVNDFKFIEDDPDVKSIFKYRFTGLSQFKLDKMPRIAWRINAMNKRKMHPGELLGLLLAVSKYEMFAKNVTYLDNYFSFCLIKDGVIEPYNYILPDPPHSYISKGDKFRKALRKKLKGYPSALRCFVQNNTKDEE